MKISVVIPAYNEEEQLTMTWDEVSKYLQEIKEDYEIIFVDDGSTDQTWDLIQSIALGDIHVCGLMFSRNFGKDAAVFAGLSYADGDVAIIMDADLQHPPRYFKQMISLWKQGNKIVEGIKTDRGKESAFKKISASIFYRCFKKFSNLDIDQSTDFKLIDRAVIDELILLKDKNAFFRGLTQWVGFTKQSFDFDVDDRSKGDSKFSLKMLIKLSYNAMMAFSYKPLILPVICLGVLLLGMIILPISRVLVWATLFTLFATLGAIAMYLIKIDQQISNRPMYIVEAVVGENKNKKESR